MVESFIVSHRRDFDGLASAAELVRYLRGSVKNVIFTNPNKSEMLPAISKLEPAKNAEIYIADLSVPQEGYEDIYAKLRTIKAAGNTIKWVDHHPWSSGAMAKFATITDMLICGEDKSNCAAELIYKNFCKSDEVSKKLAELAHFTDFNIRPQDKQLDEALVKISQCIAFLDNDDANSDSARAELLEQVSEGVITGPVVEKIYAEYKKSEEENLKMIDETIEVFSAGNYKIAIAFAHNLQSNMACSYIKNKTGASIQIFVTTKDWSAHVRSDAGIDSSVLSASLGGNGHPQASGFTLKPEASDLTESIKWYTNIVKSKAKDVLDH